VRNTDNNRTADFEAVTKDIGSKARAARLARIWHAFTDAQRAQWVRPLMKVGHSNRSAAKTLGVTPGMIAGVRHRQNIPSRNRSTGGKAKKSASNVVRLPTKRAPPRLHGAAPMYKMAASEARQCKYEGGCGYEREPGSDFCRLHGK